MKVKKFKDIEKAKEIISGRGSYAHGKVKVKLKSRIPLFFDGRSVPRSREFERQDYDSAIEYIENIVKEHDAPYKTDSEFAIKYSLSKNLWPRETYKHKLNIKQYSNDARLLKVIVSFNRN